MKIRLAVFDWNGTLLADARACALAVSQTLTNYGFKGINLAEYRHHFKVPIREMWSSMGIDPDFFEKNANDISEVFLKKYEPLEKACRTRTGARDLLQFLKKRGIRAIIFSNHPERQINLQLHRLKLSIYFDLIIGRASKASHMQKRSKGELLKKYVTKLKLNPKEVMIIGDTDEETDIARQYGYLSAGLIDGHQTSQYLKSTRPDFLISNLYQLTSIISTYGRTTKKN